MTALFDTSDLRALIHDLGKAPGRAVPAVAAVVRKGAQNINDEMRSDAESGGHYKHFSKAISWDEKTTLGSIGAEIGPDPSRKQGRLDNLLYFGSPTSGPVLDLEAPLKHEEPRFLRSIADAVAAVTKL